LARYLIVDDSPTIRLRLASALKNLSAARPDIMEAADGAEAAAAFAKAQPDVVFLDMMLGEKEGGLDVLRAMLGEHPDAVVVLLTALPGNHPDVTAAISLGAFAHIPKPIATDDLKRVIQRIELESGRMGRIR